MRVSARASRPVVSCLPCRGGTPRQVSRKRTPSRRLAQDAALPIISHQLHRWLLLLKTGKAKIFHTSSYTVQPPHSRPMQNLIEPKLTPSQCKTQQRAFQPLALGRKSKRSIDLGRCHRQWYQVLPTFRRTIFDVPDYFREREGKENISDSDGSMAMSWPGRRATRQAIILIQNPLPHSWSS